MLNELCTECRNYFLRDYTNPSNCIHEGTYTIKDGMIQALPFLRAGQYYRIVGSALNDGVHKYGGTWQQYDPPAAMLDETFTGCIWEMCIPQDVIKLASDIKQWVLDNAEAINSPYQSETTPVYSYTKAIANTGRLSTDWRQHFEGRLKPYRRVREI